MRLEFQPAELPGDLRRLMAFDRKVFPKSDLFDAAYWKQCESWWLLVDGVRAGTCAFERNVGMVRGGERVRPGSAYVATTGILPRFRGQGLGRVMKAWQISWALRNGFRTLYGATRKSNKAMIRLNRAFGFQVAYSIPGYYSEPEEAAVVMRLRLRKK